MTSHLEPSASNKVRCCRYLRKSRDDSKAETLEETLARHAKITSAMSDDAGLEIIETYEEVVSGSSIEERPEMMRLLNDMRALKWDIVVVVDISRLSRGDGSDQSKISNAFRLTGTRCLSDYRIYDLSKKDDLELFEHKLQSSRTEYKAITERLHRGTLESIKEGFAAPGVVPYGLRRVSVKGGTIYERGPNFEIVKLITEYPLAIANPTWGGLRKLLNDLGIPSPQGYEWWPLGTLRAIFGTPAYFGEVVYGSLRTVEVLGDQLQSVKKRVANDNPIRTKARWEPFLDKQEVSAALSRMQKKSPVDRDKNVANPLRGLLVCSKCGRTLLFRRGRKGSYSDYFAHSTSYSNKKGPCTCKTAPYGVVMEALKQAFLADIADKEEALHGIKEKNSLQQLQAQKAIVENKLFDARQSKLNAYRRLDDGLIDEALFKDICEAIDSRSASAHKELEEIKDKESQLNSPEKLNETIVKSKKAIEALQDEQLNPLTLNTLLKSLVKRIEYENRAGRCSHDHDIHLHVTMR